MQSVSDEELRASLIAEGQLDLEELEVCWRAVRAGTYPSLGVALRARDLLDARELAAAEQAAVAWVSSQHAPTQIDAGLGQPSPMEPAPGTVTDPFALADAVLTDAEQSAPSPRGTTEVRDRTDVRDKTEVIAGDATALDPGPLPKALYDAIAAARADTERTDKTEVIPGDVTVLDAAPLPSALHEAIAAARADTDRTEAISGGPTAFDRATPPPALREALLDETPPAETPAPTRARPKRRVPRTVVTRRERVPAEPPEPPEAPPEADLGPSEWSDAFSDTSTEAASRRAVTPRPHVPPASADGSADGSAGGSELLVFGAEEAGDDPFLDRLRSDIGDTEVDPFSAIVRAGDATPEPDAAGPASRKLPRKLPEDTVEALEHEILYADTIHDEALPDLVGQTFGVYRLVAKLGGGSMGDVYLANHEDRGQEVAFRVLPQGPSAADLTYDVRADERLAAAQEVTHPHLAGVLEYGRERGYAWVASELVRGETVAQRLRAQGPLKEAEVVAIARGVLEALEAVHAAHLVHGDVSPANIVLTPDGDVKLTDLGLVRYCRDRPYRGDPMSITPEMIKGQLPDVLADVWAFGTTLYRALSGVAPFSGDSPALVAANIRHGTPEPLAGKQPGVSPVLARIVSRAIERQRSSRYESARAILADLADWVPPGTRLRRLTREQPPGTLVRVSDRTAVVKSDETLNGLDPRLDSLLQIDKAAEGAARSQASDTDPLRSVQIEAQLAATMVAGLQAAGADLTDAEQQDDDDAFAQTMVASVSPDAADDAAGVVGAAPGAGAPSEKLGPSPAPRDTTDRRADAPVAAPRVTVEAVPLIPEPGRRWGHRLRRLLPVVLLLALIGVLFWQLFPAFNRASDLPNYLPADTQLYARFDSLDASFAAMTDGALWDDPDRQARRVARWRRRLESLVANAAGVESVTVGELFRRVEAVHVAVFSGADVAPLAQPAPPADNTGASANQPATPGDDAGVTANQPATPNNDEGASANQPAPAGLLATLDFTVFLDLRDRALLKETRRRLEEGTVAQMHEGEAIFPLKPPPAGGARLPFSALVILGHRYVALTRSMARARALIDAFRIPPEMPLARLPRFAAWQNGKGEPDPPPAADRRVYGATSRLAEIVVALAEGAQDPVADVLGRALLGLGTGTIANAPGGLVMRITATGSPALAELPLGTRQIGRLIEHIPPTAAIAVALRASSAWDWLSWVRKNAERLGPAGARAMRCIVAYWEAAGLHPVDDLTDHLTGEFAYVKNVPADGRAADALVFGIKDETLAGAILERLWPTAQLTRVVASVSARDREPILIHEAESGVSWAVSDGFALWTPPGDAAALLAALRARAGTNLGGAPDVVATLAELPISPAALLMVNPERLVLAAHEPLTPAAHPLTAALKEQFRLLATFERQGDTLGVSLNLRVEDLVPLLLLSRGLADADTYRRRGQTVARPPDTRPGTGHTGSGDNRPDNAPPDNAPAAHLPDPGPEGEYVAPPTLGLEVLVNLGTNAAPRWRVRARIRNQVVYLSARDPFIDALGGRYRLWKVVPPADETEEAQVWFHHLDSNRPTLPRQPRFFCGPPPFQIRKVTNIDGRYWVRVGSTWYMTWPSTDPARAADTIFPVETAHGFRVARVEALGDGRYRVVLHAVFRQAPGVPPIVIADRPLEYTVEVTNAD